MHNWNKSTLRRVRSVALFVFILGVIISQVIRSNSVLFSQTSTEVPAFESDGKTDNATLVFIVSNDPAKSWAEAEPETIEAKVLNFNSASIVYQLLPDLSMRNRPSNAVGKVIFSWATKDAVDADLAFRNGQYPEVIRLGKAAISSGKLPNWQQRFLVAKMVDSFWQINQKVIAGNLFLSLLKDSAPRLIYDSAPLLWQTTKVDAAMTEAANAWLKDTESKDAQLLGASWLLGTSGSSEAKSILENISQDSDTFLARLATAQLWRIATPKDVATKYVDWQSIRDSLPVPIQIGPTLAIADKLERASLPGQALQEYVRLIAIQENQPSILRLAQERAAEILRSLNRVDEANLILKSPN